MEKIKKVLLSAKNGFLKFSIKKKILVTAIPIFLLSIVVVIILSFNKNTVTYLTEKAEKGTLVTSVSASGTISSSNRVSITTQMSGVVGEVYFKNGDYVEKGQNIVSIILDQASLQKQQSAYATYLSAQNNLNSANNQMNSLQAQLFTANQTFVNGKGTEDPDTDDPTYIIQRANWLAAENNYINQQKAIAVAESLLNSASLSLAQNSSMIQAPISGTITNLSVSSGSSISVSASANDSSNSTSSQSIGNITLADGKTQASINLSEIDVTSVKIGQKTTITLDAFPNNTFTGKVTGIDTNGSVSSGVTTYPVTITFDSSLDNIYPNMAVSVEIITEIKTDVVLIPSAAITTNNNQSTVQVKRNGKISIVTVETGSSNDSQTEIISGISEGDEIITQTISNTSSNKPSSTTSSPFSGIGRTSGTSSTGSRSSSGGMQSGGMPPGGF